jgi:hypothetical protein
MIEIHANNSMLTPQIATLAFVKCPPSPKSIRVHPMQVMAIMNLYETIEVRDRRAWYWRLVWKARRLFGMDRNMTFIGLPVNPVVTVPQDEMDFLNASGEVLARIRGLAIPIEMSR